MSRFLTKRKLKALAVAAASVILLPTPFWPLSILAFIGMAVWATGSMALRHFNKASLLGARREIKHYSSIVIGDLVPRKQLKEAAGIDGEALVIVAPCRTLEASYRILLHVISILTAGGTCVITDGGQQTAHPYSLFDVPYFSLVTKKELHVEGLEKMKLRTLHASIRWLRGGVKRKHYVETPCPDSRIIELCRSHHIKLIYLINKRKAQTT